MFRDAMPHLSASLCLRGSETITACILSRLPSHFLVSVGIHPTTRKRTRKRGKNSPGSCATIATGVAILGLLRRPVNLPKVPEDGTRTPRTGALGGVNRLD